VILVTNHGATELLSMAMRRESPTDWDGTLFLFLLDEPPEIDRTLADLTDYPVKGDVVVDPDGLELAGWGEPVVSNEKAVIQFGPPVVKCLCPTSFSCTGHAIADEDDQVFWIERYDTPVAVTGGGLLQVAVTLAFWGECPPLPGGCS
jgi:hypothetical protein